MEEGNFQVEEGNSKKSRCSPKKCYIYSFIIPSLILFLLLSGFVIYLFWTPIINFFKPLPSDKPDFCRLDDDGPDYPTPTANWSELIDFSVDPCQDFYAFTCGLQKPFKPKCKSLLDWNEFVKLFHSGTMHASKLMIKKCQNESIYGNNHNDSTAIKKFQQYRDTYIKNRNEKDLTIDQLVQNIKSFGGCPAISSTQWNPDNFDLTYSLQKLSNLTAKMHLFKWAVEILNSTFVLSIAAEKSSNFRFIKKQSNKLNLTLKLLNTIDNPESENMNYTQVVSEIMRVFDDVSMIYKKLDLPYSTREVDEFGLETLKTTSADLEAFRFDKLNNSLSIIDASYFTENINTFLQLRSHLSTNPQVYFKQKQLLVKLNEFYSNLTDDQMANFLCTKYLLSQFEHIDFKPLNETYPEIITDLTKEIKEGKKDLLDTMSTAFPRVVDHLFISRCTNPDTYHQIHSMIDEMKVITYQTIEGQSWIDQKSKNGLLSKLDHLKTDILGVDLVRDIKKLDKFYEILEFDKNDTLKEMNLKLGLFTRKRKLEMAFKDLSRELLLSEIRVTETGAAAYGPFFNSLTIFAGILFPPNYHVNRLSALNYGGIGATIGHELGHAFHLTGRNFDAMGKRTPLLDQQTSRNFMERTKCFINQYNQYEDKEVGDLIQNEGPKIANYTMLKYNHTKLISKLNGTKTLEENLSDNFGLRLAYEAYKAHLNGSVEPRLADFPQFRNDQLFFLSYGSVWCNQYSPFERLFGLYIDNHAPSKARANMVMQNSKQFAEAFKCPAGSPMNPVEKCQMWE